MFNERLKTLRIQRKMTQSELAKKIYISQPAYSKYEVGTASPNPETLSKIADALDVSVDYLLGSDSQPARPGYIRIPVLGRVAAGIPIDAIEEVIDWEDISAEAAGDGEYFGLQIKGHSMEPKISDGDVVIVRRQPDVDSGDIAVVLVNGDDATVKRVKKSPQGVTLIPSNPTYEPMYYTNAEIESLPVQILGRVVELRAKF
ncbi:MAG: LexA family protein [Oscillospiraceae bacterium]